MEHKKTEWLNKENIIIAVLIIACIFAFWWLSASVKSSYRSGYFHPQRYSREYLNSATTTPLSVGDIQSWMTFDYLNKIFNLPSEYLRQTLNIQDSYYPNLQLSKYAKRNNIDVQEFLKSIQSAVQSFKK